MSLDGLRAWIGVVERKLTMRTRVFLVLVALAVGGAGAATYLALDAQDKAVTESDLEAVRDELASGTGETASAEIARLEGELDELRGEIEALRSANGGPGADGGAEGGVTTPRGGASGGSAESGGASAPEREAQLKQLLEKAQEQEAK